MHITSPANVRAKALAKLAEKKYRAESGLFLLEGEEFVARAAAHGWQVEEMWQDEALSASTFQHANTLITTRSVLSRITGKPNPQAVLGVLRQRWNPLPDAADGLWLALDRPRDPGNLGTILRTADATGVAGCILIGEATDPYAPECVRASMGSLLHVPLVACSEAEFIAWARNPVIAGAERQSSNRKPAIIGTHLKATQDFRTISPVHPVLLLMGNESHGLTDALSDACTSLVRIPMAGHTESLNLATATALLLYHLHAAELV